MKKQIDRILICILWLLAATLGACFWLNTIFGFNIFSGQHWQYLAYLQAAQTPVRPTFYISLSGAIIIALVGLYILVRPRGLFRRRIGIGRAAHRAMPQTTSPPPQAATTQPARTAPQQNAAAAPTTTARPGAPLTRPRPLGITPHAVPAPPTAQAATTQSPILQAAQNPAPVSIDFEQLQKIFTDAGYVVKHSPRIANFKPAVFAIGANETLWMGGVGIDTTTVSNAMERLDTIFTDTLDDIKINISGFVIAPPAGAAATDNIHLFRTPDELNEYMSAHRNTPPDDADGQENFDAYSEYIDTVINYMDKT